MSTSPALDLPTSPEIDALLSRTSPLSKYWVRQSVADFAPSLFLGSAPFLTYVLIHIIILAAALYLIIGGRVQLHKDEMLYPGIAVLAVWLISMIIWLFPVLKAGLPCTLPPPPTHRYPFSKSTTDHRPAFFNPSKPPSNQAAQTQSFTPTSITTYPFTKITHTQIYIIFNPASGTGKSQRVLNDIVLPSLRAKNIKSTLCPTNYPGHARDYAFALPFEGYSSIMVLGGDGSLFEVVNGMLERKFQHQQAIARELQKFAALQKKDQPDSGNDGKVDSIHIPDFAKITSLPISLIPAGSGNSFSADLGTWDPKEAMEWFFEGYTAPCDVNHVKDLYQVYLESKEYQDLAANSTSTNTNTNTNTNTANTTSTSDKNGKNSNNKTKQSKTSQTLTAHTADDTINSKNSNKNNENNQIDQNDSNLTPADQDECGHGDCTISQNDHVKLTTLAVDSDIHFPSQLPLNVYSINTCAYGLIGDLAVAAEKCRWLGTQRYSICGFWGLCKKMKFPTTVVYLSTPQHSGVYAHYDQAMAQRELDAVSGGEVANTDLSSETKHTYGALTDPDDEFPERTNASKAKLPQPATSQPETELIVETDVFITAFANHTKYFGKGHYVAPLSYNNDGYCDVTVATDTGRANLIPIFNQLPSGSHINGTHPALRQYKTNDVAFISYRQNAFANADVANGITELMRSVSVQNSSKQTTSSSLPSSLSSELYLLPSKSPVQEVVERFASKFFKSDLAQNFITIDGEIYACYGGIYVKTIPHAFRVFASPSGHSLHNAAAVFKE